MCGTSSGIFFHPLPTGIKYEAQSKLTKGVFRVIIYDRIFTFGRPFMNEKKDVNTNKDGLLSLFNTISRQLRDGQYDEVNLAHLAEVAPDAAQDLGEFIENLKEATPKLNIDCEELPLVSEHLNHISKSTESGVMNIIDTTELLMEEIANINESLVQIEKEAEGNDEIARHIRAVEDAVNVLQGHTFSVITSVEFDDINQQLMQKILTRLEVLYTNLFELLGSLNVQVPIAREDSAFLDALKHIIDIDGSDRQDQNAIDDLFEAF